MRAFDKVESLISQAAPDRLLCQCTCRNWHLVMRPTSILECQTSNWLPGLSPHAPYTVRPELVTKVCEESRVWQVPVAMHLAESVEESS